MNRLMLLILAIHCSYAATTLADEYLLRLEVVGYENKPASAKDLKETILHSMEVVVRPRSPFHAKAQVGTHTLLIGGELHPGDCGDYNVEIRYTHLTDTGKKKRDGREPLPNKSSLSTTINFVVHND